MWCEQPAEDDHATTGLNVGEIVESGPNGLAPCLEIVADCDGTAQKLDRLHAQGRGQYLFETLHDRGKVEPGGTGHRRGRQKPADTLPTDQFRDYWHRDSFGNERETSLLRMQNDIPGGVVALGR